MSQTMRRCPNCGAYVMSSDNICPRCDHLLYQPANNSPITSAPDAAGDAEPVFAPPEETHEEAPSPASGLEEDPASSFALEEKLASLFEPSTEEAESQFLPEMTPPTAEVEESEGGVALEPESESGFEPESEAKRVSEEIPPADEDRAYLPTTRLPHARPVFDRPPTPPADNPVEDVESGLVIAEEADDSPPEPDAAPESAVVFDLDESLGIATADLFGIEATQPRLQNALAEDSSEIPTAPFVPVERANMNVTAPSLQGLVFTIPRAPYTPPPVPAPPPPVMIAPPSHGYMPPVRPSALSAGDYLQRRVQEYQEAGYRRHGKSSYEATLSYGKSLGVGGWLLALISVIGFFWYALLLVLSGFQRDKVDVVLESDGLLYEYGPGAAHIRRQRARVGRRWAMFGVMIFVFSLVLVILAGVVAGIVLSNERYQAALREAYPAVTLFEEHFSATEATPDDVSLAKDGAVAYAIVSGIAVVGLWGGATLWVIGTVHARAYRVQISPLPGWG